MNDLYLKTACPKCQAINWTFWESWGNYDDTYMMPDGLECCVCKHKWVFDLDGWVDEKATEIFNWNHIDWVDPDVEMIDRLVKTGVTPDGKSLEFFINELAYIKLGQSTP